MRVSAAVIPIALAVAHDARAICGHPGDVLFVPYGDGVAPLNARVHLSLPATWRTIAIECSPMVEQREPEGTCEAGRFDLTLRRAITSQTEDADVPVAQRESAAGDQANVELVPRARLAPRTRYEVWLRDEGHRARPHVVATFTTGDMTDDAPPVWTGITRAQRTTGAGECEVDGIRIVAAPATDDKTPAAQLRYGLWIAEGRAGIDYDTPPLAYLRGAPIVPRAGALRAEVDLTVDAASLGPTFAGFGGKKASLTIGLRAFDLAGNASPASEATLER